MNYDPNSRKETPVEKYERLKREDQQQKPKDRGSKNR
jgi:hypothetical protein